MTSERSKNSLRKWNKMGRRENNAVKELREKAFIVFYFIFRLEGRSSTNFHLKPSWHLLFLSFMSRAWISKDNCEGIVFDWSIKSSPLARLLRLQIKTSRQDSGEDRTGEGAGSCSKLSGLWWQRSSRDKRAPPSRAEIKTGNISLGPVPGKEPWAVRKRRGRDATGQPCRQWASEQTTCKNSPSQDPVGITITPVTTRPLCHWNTRKSVSSRGWHPGCRATWSPRTWLQSFPPSLWILVLCPKSPTSPTGLGTDHHQTDLTFLLSASSNFISPAWTVFYPPLLPGSYTSFKIQLKDPFLQNTL